MNGLNKVRICAEGVERARLLSALEKNEIAVCDFALGKGRKFSFSVSKKDLRKTFAILDETCYNYNADSITDGAKAFVRLLRRLGLLIAAAVVCVALALSQTVIWKLEITGNEVVPDKTVELALRKHGVAPGKRKASFDSEALSAAIRDIDGISLASVYLVGTTVKVEVFESERTSDKLAYSDTDILSRFDGVVTRVVTREGTPLVRVGQNVFAGTPLIGAYRAPLEGEENIPTRASGIVYGTVAHTDSRVVSTEQIEYEREWVRTRTRLELFGLTIGKRAPSGEGYSVTERKSGFDTFLPLKVVTSRVEKLAPRKVTVPIETLAQKAEDEIMLGFISEHAPSGYSSTRSVRDLGGGLYRVTVFVQAEIVIGGA